MARRNSQRLGYVYASPLVRKGAGGRVERMGQLGTDEELEMIRKKLRESGREIKFRADVATSANLREILNDGCRMLHYTGHGNIESLAFESNDYRNCGIMEPLYVTPLKLLFQAGGVRTELVFISSCSSELSGNAFVEAGVPHVVAVKRESSVSDQAAQQFANQFYDALMSEDGRFTVQQAYEIALNTVNADNPKAPPQGDHFLLLPLGGNHDVRIFHTLPEGSLIDETRVPPPRPPGTKPVPFYQGLEEVQSVVGMLVSPVSACVTIVGEHGSGKTERAIQACDYVRKRHYFDAVVWVDVKKAVEEAAASAARMWRGYDDICALIGVAAGMAQPGPRSEHELAQFLFKNPTTEGGAACEKVLLVLDDVDSLLERGGDARDRLVVLLDKLISHGAHLKLLVTSEESLLIGTNERFRHGSEKVAKVQRLRDRDAAQLLMDKLPRRFTKLELGLGDNYTRSDILESLMKHRVMVAAEGHPGTLLRLAPLLERHKLDDDYVVEMALRHRQEYRDEESRGRMHSRASSVTSLTSDPGGGGGNGGGSDLGQEFAPRTPTRRWPLFGHDTHLLQAPWIGHGGGGTTHWLNLGGGMAEGGGLGSSMHGSMAGASSRASSQPHHQRRHSAFQHPSSPVHNQHRYSSRPLRRMTIEDHQMAMQVLEGPDPPQMRKGEKEAWDTARNAGLDRGCRLVWVKASANAEAAEWTFDGGGGGDGGEVGAETGEMGEAGAGSGGGKNARYDCVPWRYLQQGLMQHLCGRLTIPSSQDEVVDDGPWAHEEYCGYSGGGTGEARLGGGYGAMNTPPVRWMNSEEISFVHGVLKAKQDNVRKRQMRLRREVPTRGLVGSELGSKRSNGAADAADGDDDVITLDAFVEFSLWWAPLMATLSVLRNDWASTNPIRVHGFMSRIEAERRLFECGRGTFLLRFSESKPGDLVVSFTEQVTQAPVGSSISSSAPASSASSASSSSVCVKHCLVEVREGGTFSIEMDQGKLVQYKSLHDLVRDCNRMQTLYPDVPKEDAFFDWTGCGSEHEMSIPAYPPDVTRLSRSVAGGEVAVVTLEEWGSRPIEGVLMDRGE